MGFQTPMLNNFQSMCVDDTLNLIQYAHGRIVQIDFADIHGGMDHSQRKMDQKNKTGQEHKQAQ